MRIEFDPNTGFFDWALTPRGGFDPGYGNGGALEAAFWISIFTDLLADAADMTPDLGADRRGVWFDAGLPPAYRMGSRIWLYMRSKKSEKVRVSIENEAIASTQWMVDDGLALAIDVTATWIDQPRDALRLVGVLTEPNGVRRDWKTDLLWGGIAG
jgi:phage gp46-like protein